MFHRAVAGVALAVVSVSGCAPLAEGPGSGAPGRPDPAALVELAPTGKIRFGVVFAPAPSTFFVAKDAGGQPRGVTVELANGLARRLGTPVEFMVAPNSGELTDALANGAIDAAFMPVDDERRKRLDFGPNYFVGRNTYLVRAGSDIRTMADVDRPEVRVVGISGTTTIRSAARVLKTARVSPATSVDDALEMLRSGKADAFALTHDTLPPLAARVPGSRILDGDFNRVYVAIAVQKNRPAALAYVTAFMEDAKASGAVRQAFNNAGFKAAEVAPRSGGR